jgi:hypothetical protein
MCISNKVFNGGALQERGHLLHQLTTLSCRILSSNNIVKLIAPVVARRVPFFLPRDPVVHDTLAVFEQPDANNEEVVPKEPDLCNTSQLTTLTSLLLSPLFLFVDWCLRALLYAKLLPNLMESIVRK